MPSKATAMPLAEINALMFIGAWIGEASSGGSKYISLTTRK